MSEASEGLVMVLCLRHPGLLVLGLVRPRWLRRFLMAPYFTVAVYPFLSDEERAILREA